MKYKEVEFKYYATISLKAFEDIFYNMFPRTDPLVIFGKDTFYSNPISPSSFFRHRTNQIDNELTYKSKTTEENSFIRVEHNLELKGQTEESVKEFLKDIGYRQDFSLYKTCYIWTVDNYHFSYYVCFDMNMKEKGRFIEIEVDENTVQDCWEVLIALEKSFKKAGLKSMDRINKSLYELYKEVT